MKKIVMRMINKIKQNSYTEWMILHKIYNKSLIKNL